MRNMKVRTNRKMHRSIMHGTSLSPGVSTTRLSLCSVPQPRRWKVTAAPVTDLPILHLPTRVQDRPMPSVSIVDMRQELKAGNRSMFSRQLHDAILGNLSRGEQAVLLLNRRGYSTFVMCRSCGYTAECPHCEIALTYHRVSHNLRCHYCGYARPEQRQCPECNSEHIRYFGTGTQKVEERAGAPLPRNSGHPHGCGYDDRKGCT